MSKLKIGDVFEKNSTKYVLFDKTFKEWYNTGGMGEYEYKYILLDDLMAFGECTDEEKLGLKVLVEKDTTFKEGDVKILEDEAPYDFSTRQVTLYSVRRKKMKTQIVWE